jgi:hypothetical protein
VTLDYFGLSISPKCLSVNSEYVTPEIRSKETMDHLNTLKNAAKTLIFSKRWTNYTLMKKDTLPAVAKIDENLKLAMPDIIDVNTEINTEIVQSSPDFINIFNPITLDSLRTIMSMIGSFNKVVSDAFKAAGYISIACSVDPLKPEELMSINNYDNFFNYEDEDVDESPSGGGNKIINMKGGTKFNERFNELIDIVDLSGKVNLLIYIFSILGSHDNLKHLLQCYNLYLENLDTRDEDSSLAKLNSLLSIINIDHYNRLFYLYNCVVKKEEELSKSHDIHDDSVIEVFFQKVRNGNNDELLAFYKTIEQEYTSTEPSYRKSRISPDFTQDKIVSSGNFQELPDLYMGLTDDIQEHLFGNISSRFDTLPINIIKGIYFALDSRLQLQYKGSIIELLVAKQVKIGSSRSFQELPDLYMGLAADIQEHLFGNISSGFDTLPPNIIKGIYFALVSELQLRYKGSIIELLVAKQVEIVSSHSFQKLPDLYIGLAADIQEHLFGHILSRFNTLHRDIQRSIMEELDESLILKLSGSSIENQNVQEYCQLNNYGKQILEFYPSSTEQLGTQTRIITNEKTTSTQICLDLSELYSRYPDLNFQFDLFKNLNTEIQDYLLPHLSKLQLHIAKLEQTKIITETQKYAKLVELYSTLKPEIQRHLLDQPFTLNSSVGTFVDLVLFTLNPTIIIGIYSELDGELQKIIINKYPKNIHYLLQYSKFKVHREVIKLMPQQAIHSMGTRERHTPYLTEEDKKYLTRLGFNPERYTRIRPEYNPSGGPEYIYQDATGHKIPGPRGGTRRKHHTKRKTIKRKKNRKTYKKRLHKNRKRRTHKG